MEQFRRNLVYFQLQNFQQQLTRNLEENQTLNVSIRKNKQTVMKIRIIKCGNKQAES